MVENLGGDCGGFVDIIVAVVDDFGLDDGDDASLLTGKSVFREIVAVLGDCFIGRGEDVIILINTEFEGGAPFSEAEAHLVVFSETVVETVEAFGESFERVGVKGLETLVDLDAGDDTLTGEMVDEILAIIGNLTGGFIKEDDAVNVIGETWGGKEDIAVVATIIISISDLKLVEFLVDTATGFVSSEDAFGVEDEVIRDEFEIVGGLVVVHGLKLLEGERAV